MAGNKTEMAKLTRVASRAGCHITRRSNGHYRITAPNNAWMDMSFSPGSPKTVRFIQKKVATFIETNCREGS